ncbi:MAG: polymerase, partial [Bacteroidota bacterium]|nr:polymerase [Bacteroidota bacterium]
DEKSTMTPFDKGGTEEGIKKIKDIQHDYHFVNSFEKLEKLLNELEKAELISFDLETSSLDRLSCEIVGIALSIKEGEAYYIPVEEIDDDGNEISKSQRFSEKKLQPDSEKELSLFNNISSADYKITKKESSGTSMFDFSTPVEEEVSNVESKKGKKLYDDSLPVGYVINKLKPVLEKQSIGKCGQNSKFDTFILKRYGIDVSPVVFDSMIASYLINADTPHNLDALSIKWLGYSPVPISSLIGEKKSSQRSMREIEPNLISDYACEDADLALKLRNKMYPALKEDNLLRLAEDIEFPLVETLTRMEMNGIAIDTDSLSAISIQLGEEAARLTDNIYKEAGELFNIDSPKQLGNILFNKMMLPPVHKTKTGYSTDVSVLSQLAPSYPIARMVLEYRQLVKLKSTYVDALPKLINPRTGRIHTTYNQTVASTGRLSSTDPNLQNIPIRTEQGKEIRRAFVAQGDDKILLSADYSQIELRIMAYISGDAQLIRAFKDGLDIHAATSAILYDIPLSQVDSDMRRVAKTVNFGIMYGLGSFGLSQRLGLGRKESQTIIDNYFIKYPGIKKYINETINFARANGYAETICGRRRFFPDLNNRNKNIQQGAERAAINMPIQGAASDMMKIAMIAIDKEMRRRNFKSLMMLQVHDELVFEAKKNELEELRQLVKEKMESALILGDVPVIAETGTGQNWLDAH